MFVPWCGLQKSNTYNPHAVAPNPKAVNAARVYETRSRESEFAMLESMGLGPVFNDLADVFGNPLLAHLGAVSTAAFRWPRKIEC